MPRQISKRSCACARSPPVAAAALRAQPAKLLIALPSRRALLVAHALPDLEAVSRLRAIAAVHLEPALRAARDLLLALRVELAQRCSCGASSRRCARSSLATRRPARRPFRPARATRSRSQRAYSLSSSSSLSVSDSSAILLGLAASAGCPSAIPRSRATRRPLRPKRRGTRESRDPGARLRRSGSASCARARSRASSSRAPAARH